jgi:hypothetical protein
MLEEQPKWTVTEGRRGPVAANRSLISRSCGRMRQKPIPKAQRRRERPSNGDWLKEQYERKRWQSTLTFPPIFIAGNLKTDLGPRGRNRELALGGALRSRLISGAKMPMSALFQANSTLQANRSSAAPHRPSPEFSVFFPDPG